MLAKFYFAAKTIGLLVLVKPDFKAATSHYLFGQAQFITKRHTIPFEFIVFSLNGLNILVTHWLEPV
jgi:hypothetical protein